MENVSIVDETTPVVNEDSTTSTEVTAPEDGAPAADVEAPATSEPEGEKKSDAQERIRQLVARQREAERKSAYLEGQLEALKRPTTERAAEVQGRPTADRFASYDDYIEAVADWKAREAYRDEQTRYTAKQEAEKAKAAESTRKQKFSEQMVTARAKHEDFDEVTVYNSDLKVSAAMLETIEDSDYGAEVAYYLGKNPAEASRIAQLSPLGAAKEIGKLELKFSNPAQPEVKRVSSAAPPVGTLAGNASSTVVPSKMSDSEWYAWHKAEKAKQFKQK